MNNPTMCYLLYFFERKVQFCLGEEFSNNSISLWPEHNNTLRHHHHVYDLAARREFLLWGFCYGRPLNSVLYLFPHKTTQRLEKVLDKLKQGGSDVFCCFWHCLILFDLTISWKLRQSEAWKVGHGAGNVLFLVIISRISDNEQLRLQCFCLEKCFCPQKSVLMQIFNGQHFFEMRKKVNRKGVPVFSFFCV